MSALSERIRRDWAANDAIRDAGLTTPGDVRRFDDIAYGSHPQQKLDVYRPKNAEGLLPVIVSVHGGGWVYGDKELYQYYTMELARRGFAVVNFSYRLAPESKFPAQLEDVNAVFCWTKENAEQYGFDMEHLFAVGDSAGAHLLGLYCDFRTNPGYASRFSFDGGAGPVPKAVSLACGAYSMRLKDAPARGQDLELMADLLPGEVNAESLALVDVLKHITPAFPPTFLFTSSGDFLQEQADELQKTLRMHKVPHIMRFYGSADLILEHVFQENIRSESAKICNDEQCDFFRKVMEARF